MSTGSVTCSTYLAERPVKDRRIALALFAGVVAGIISALEKLGFETLIPPRTLSPPHARRPAGEAGL